MADRDLVLRGICLLAHPVSTVPGPGAEARMSARGEPVVKSGEWEPSRDEPPAPWAPGEGFPDGNDSLRQAVDPESPAPGEGAPHGEPPVEDAP